MQRRFVAVVTSVITTEHEAGAFDPTPCPPGTRTGCSSGSSESFTYADLISGETPDPERARTTFEYILRP